METITSLEAPVPIETLAMMRQKAFREVSHEALMKIDQEMSTALSFSIGNRKFPVNSSASGVRALGQVPLAVLQRLHKQMINPDRYVISN